jgi:hypothetical protein
MDYRTFDSYGAQVLGWHPPPTPLLRTSLVRPTGCLDLAADVRHLTWPGLRGPELRCDGGQGQRVLGVFHPDRAASGSSLLSTSARPLPNCNDRRSTRIASCSTCRRLTVPGWSPTSRPSGRTDHAGWECGRWDGTSGPVGRRCCSSAPPVSRITANPTMCRPLP